MNQYEQLIQDLVDGKIDKIEVEHDLVMLFRDAWIKREDRKYVVGEAHHGGNVTYRYDPTVL